MTTAIIIISLLLGAVLLVSIFPISIYLVLKNEEKKILKKLKK